MWVIILMTMLFCHIVDDYYLQGCLAKLKQKQWWKDNVDNYEMYKYDYIIALIMHGFSWSFMIHLPLIWCAWNMDIVDTSLGLIFGMFIILQACIHADIDNEKANKLSLCLMDDQLGHLIQIVVSFIFFGFALAW